MSCGSVLRDLPLFVGGELDAKRQDVVARHLAECSPCRVTEGELRASREWLRSAPSLVLSEADSAALRRRVWEEIDARAPEKSRDRFPARRLVFGALLVALFAALLTLRSRQTPRPPEGSPLAQPEAVASDRKTGEAVTGRESIDSGVVKIEFQTANPEVRIIWFAKRGTGIPSAPAAGRNPEVS